MLIGLAAAVIAATPGSLDGDLRRAAPGDTVRLARGGDFERINLAGREFTPPLTIDATGATVRGVTLRKVSGLSSSGTADDAATANERGTESMSEQISANWSAVNSKPLPLDTSVAVTTSSGWRGRRARSP